MKTEGSNSLSSKIFALFEPKASQAPEDPPDLNLGQDSLSLSGNQKQPMTREEWLREFSAGFNRGPDSDSVMAASGFFTGAAGLVTLGFAYETAGVAIAVPVIGAILAVGGIAACGIGLYRKLNNNREESQP